MNSKEQALVDRVLDRLEALGGRFPAMKTFRKGEQTGDDFITYEHGVTWEEDPDYARKLEEFQERARRERMPSMRAMRERPEPKHARYVPDGIRLMIRIDSGARRTQFPLVVSEEFRFGESQFSLVEIEGPDSEGFRALRSAIHAILREEVALFRA